MMRSVTVVDGAVVEVPTSAPEIPELEHTKRGHYECPACGHQGTAPTLCPQCEETPDA